MSMKLFSAVCLFGVATADLPECASGHDACLFHFDPLFGDVVKMRLRGNYGGIQGNKEWQQSFCDLENWKKKSEVCGHCAYDLLLTRGVPAEYIGRRYCLMDMDLSPYVEEQHMYIRHPLNGKEMEVVTHTGGHGCEASHWPGGNLTGKIHVGDTNQWDCHYWARHRFASSLGSPLGVMTINLAYHRFFGNRPRMLGGSSQNLESTVMYTSQDSLMMPMLELLRNATREGRQVFGKVVYNCRLEGEPYANPSADLSQFGGDHCPWWFMDDAMCATRPEPANKLCASCPLQVLDDTGKQVSCLTSHDMLPTRAHHLISKSFPMPLAERVVYISELPQSGMCKVSDFAEWAGRIVVYDPVVHSGRCDRADTMMAAQLAGVKAVIMLGRYRQQGVSYDIEIPSAQTDSVSNSQSLDEFLRTGTELRAGVFEKDVTFDVPPLVTDVPTPAPPSPFDPVVDPVASTDEVLDEAGALAGVVLIPILVALIVAKIIHTKKTTIALPEGSSGISLSAGSTLLSLTMAVILTAITFYLTFEAGQQGVDTASDSGETVSKLATDMNTNNVRQLSDQTLIQMLVGAMKTYGILPDLTIQSFISLGLPSGRNFNYAEFLEVKRKIAEAKHVLPLLTIDSTSMHYQIMWRNGFYMDSRGVSNNLPNDPSITSAWNATLRTSDGVVVDPAFYDPRKLVYTSELPGEYSKRDAYTIEYLKDTLDPLSDAEGRYEFSRYQTGNPFLYQRYQGPSISRIQSYIQDGGVVGVLTLTRPMLDVSRIVWEALQSEQARNPLAQNLSFCFYRDDEVIVSAQEDHGVWSVVDNFGPYIGGSGNDPGTQWQGYEQHTLDNTPMKHFNALRNLFLEKYGTIVAKKLLDGGGQTAVVEKFDQAKYFAGASDVLVHLPFDGSAADTSGNNWDTIVTCAGGGTGCWSFVYGRNGQAIRMDGTAKVEVYPYLTQRVPRVAATRVATADGSWRSFRMPYSMTRMHDGIGDVIVRPARLTGNDTLPAYRERFHLTSHGVSMWLRPDAAMADRGGVLFTDTSSVAAGVRLFIDGSVWFLTRRYGCRTEPVPGGLPAGVWTHVAMTAQFRGTQYCEVYINGALQSRGRMSMIISMPLTWTNYSIGDGFVGDMDDLRFHNRTLVTGDVQALMRGEPQFVESREFSAVALTDDKHKAIPAVTFALAVPHEDIVREAEAAAARLERNLVVQRDNTNKKLDRKLLEALCVVVVVLLVSALLFLTFNERLTKPFAAFAMEIDAVAQIDVDGREPTAVGSCLLEITVMSKAMCLLVRNMKEYKSFMPLSMQTCVAHDDTSEDVDSSSKADAVRRSESGSHRTHSRSDSRSQSTHRTQYHNQAKHATELLAASLTKRKMSLVLVNIHNFHKSISAESEKAVIDRHQQYIQLCIDCAQPLNGMPESFSGDRVLITFNGVRTCSGHQEACAVMSLAIRDRWAQQGNSEAVNIAISYGTMRAGNIGAQSMRRYTMLGSAVSWLYGLERFGREKNKAVVADSLFADSLKGRLEYRHYAAVRSTKFSGGTGRTPMLVAEVLQVIEAAEDEWMYQLESAARSSGNGLWNELFEHVVFHRWDAAEKCLESKEKLQLTASDCFDELRTAVHQQEYMAPELRVLL